MIRDKTRRDAQCDHYSFASALRLDVGNRFSEAIPGSRIPQFSEQVVVARARSVLPRAQPSEGSALARLSIPVLGGRIDSCGKRVASAPENRGGRHSGDRTAGKIGKHRYSRTPGQVCRTLDGSRLNTLAGRTSRVSVDAEMVSLPAVRIVSAWLHRIEGEPTNSVRSVRDRRDPASESLRRWPNETQRLASYHCQGVPALRPQYLHGMMGGSTQMT